MALGGFALNRMFTADHSRLDWLQTLLVAITFIGFFTWVWSILRLRKVIICPSCGKPLNYLLTDPSYSKTFAQFSIPKDLPSNITACPYCKADIG